MYSLRLNESRILAKFGPRAQFLIAVAGKKVTGQGITLTDNEFMRLNTNEMSDLQNAVDKGLVIFENEGVVVTSVAEAEDSAIRVIGSAMMGDIAIEITPLTVDTPATSESWKRTVEITFKDSNDAIHGWLSTTFTGAVSIGDTSVAGTASIASADLIVSKGRASIEIIGDATDWLAGETDTLTIASVDIMGNTIAGATSVETFA